jgi:outer membrane lipoprotein SlyB
MNTQASTMNSSRFPPALIWTAAIALILFCGAGIGAIMGWIPTSMGNTPDSTVIDKNAAVKTTPKTNAATVAPRAAKPPVQVASNTPVKARCTDCGVIESTREVTTKGSGSGIGGVGGAVVGGLLGNQVGGGRGQDVMTVVGAVGGALAGNEIEKRVKSTKSFEVTVRLDDGSTRVISEANATSWRAGDKVRVVNGAIQPTS